MAEERAVVAVDLLEVGRCFGDAHGCTLPMAAVIAVAAAALFVSGGGVLLLLLACAPASPG